MLAREQGVPLRLVDLGTIDTALELPGVRHLRLGAGTANFALQPAMTVAQCAAALQAGRDTLQQVLAEGCDLFLAGEMGIGNTSAATALACALSDLQPAQLTGPGTGLDGAGVGRKLAVIERALALHREHLADPRRPCAGSAASSWRRWPVPTWPVPRPACQRWSTALSARPPHCAPCV